MNLKKCKYLMGLPWWLSSKKSSCNAGDTGLTTGSERACGEGNHNPLQYSCLEKSLGQRSLAGCSSLNIKNQTQRCD